MMGEIDKFAKDYDYVGPGHLASMEGGVEREKRGWGILKDLEVECGGCRKPLFGVTKVKENPEKLTELKGLCPYCGSDSFLIEVDGDIVLGPAPGTVLVDFETSVLDNEGKHIKTIVKVEKNG
jgi:hypothetical protein